MNITVADTETNGFCGELKVIGFYDGEKFKFFNDVTSFLKYIKKNYNDIIIYWHNLTYDFRYFMEKKYLKYFDMQSFTLAKSNILRIKMKDKNIEFRDSLQLLGFQSLKQLSRDFQVKHVKQDYDDYEQHSDNVKMLNYLMYDLQSLYEVLEEFIKIIGIKHLKLTTPSVAMSIWSDTLPKYMAEGIFKVKFKREHRDFIRQAYYGGRSEVFKRYGKNLYYYDVNSLYPYVMLNKKYPIGSYFYTHNPNIIKRNFESGLMGIIEATVEENRYIPLLPSRIDGKLMFLNGIKTGIWTSAELKEFVDTGGKILEYKRAIFWRQSEPIFKQYVKHYYEIKKTSKGAKRSVAKLMLNSLYGKFGQHSEFTRYCDIDTAIEKLFNDYDSSELEIFDWNNDIFTYKINMLTDYMKPHISVFISSYARIELYRYLQMFNDSVYYCDTDSIIIDRQLSDTYIGEEIGKMKLEAKIDEGVFIAPKLYAYISDDTITIKGKGIMKEELKRISYHQYYDLIFNKPLEVKHKRIIGIKESNKLTNTKHNKNKYLNVIHVKKKITGKYDKRKVCDDRIKTKPWNINEIMEGE